MARVGRPPSCECGECAKCKHRIYMRKWYAAKSPAERAAWVARRDGKTVRKNDRARHRRDREKRNALMRDRPRSVAADEAARRWRLNNPEGYRAHNVVNSAIRDGRLERGPCEAEGDDCYGKIHAHHDDYTKPLEVRWLCAAHHRVEHIVYVEEWN